MFQNFSLFFKIKFYKSKFICDILYSKLKFRIQYNSFLSYRCYDAHLNGVFPVVPNRDDDTYITWWNTIDGTKVPLVLDFVEMKLRPTQ